MRILVNFTRNDGWSVHCLAADCRTLISQWVTVRTDETLLRLLKASGAYTYEHCTRLVDLGLGLAREIGYQDDTLYKEVEYGVTYKDVGEVGYFLTRESPRQKQAAEDAEQ